MQLYSSSHGYVTDKGFLKELVKNAVSFFWSYYDTKDFGAITKHQAQELVMKTLKMVGKENLWKEESFDRFYELNDTDHDGALVKKEASSLIMDIIRRKGDPPQSLMQRYLESESDEESESESSGWE